MNKRNVSFSFDIWWPDLKGNWRSWLPTRGNVLFTLIVVASLVWASKAGALSLGAPSAAGLSTGTIAYQGRLADTSGSPLTGTYSMIFRLYSAATGGAPLWTEQWTGPNSVQVSDGLFNVMLGSIAPIQQSVITGNDSLWLGITVGTDDEMAPRVQLGSVPFAVQAQTVTDGSVTTEKLSDGSITTEKLANGSVTASKLDLATGNLGIGTINPETALDVRGAAPQVTVKRLSDSYGMTIGYDGIFNMSNLANYIFRVGGNPILFLHGPSGNVGIGTTNPFAKLDIQTDANSQIVNIGTGSDYRLKLNTLNENSIQKYSFSVVNQGTTHPDMLVLNYDGNIGIGTSDPRAPLEIYNPGKNSAIKLIRALQNNNEFGGAIWAKYDFDIQRDILAFGVANNADPSAQTQERMRITNYGEVGIGTTNPTTILTIKQGGGNVLADGYATYSSRRWKTNIAPITNALGIVEQLRGVTFDWRENGKHDLGLIAEEVGKVLPDIVTYEANGQDARSVDYTRLVAVLVEATKQQQITMDTQQQQITALQQQNKTLDARLSAIERAIQTGNAPVTRVDFLPGWAVLIFGLVTGLLLAGIGLIVYHRYYVANTRS